MEHIQPGSRIVPETTGPARLAGRMAPEWISPIRVDHFINSMTGRLWGSAMNLDWPGLSGYGRLTLRSDHPSAINNFYREFERVEQLRNTLMLDSIQGQRTPQQQREAQARVPREIADRYHTMEWANRLMNDLRAPIRSERDRTTRFEVERYTIGLARAIMGERELPRYPNPLRPENWREMPAGVREEVIRHIQPQVMSMSAPQPEMPRNANAMQMHELPERMRAWQERRHGAYVIMGLTGMNPGQMQTLLLERQVRERGVVNRATLDRLARVR